MGLNWGRDSAAGKSSSPGDRSKLCSPVDFRPTVVTAMASGYAIQVFVEQRAGLYRLRLQQVQAAATRIVTISAIIPKSSYR